MSPLTSFASLWHDSRKQQKQLAHAVPKLLEKVAAEYKITQVNLRNSLEKDKTMDEVSCCTDGMPLYNFIASWTVPDVMNGIFDYDTFLEHTFKHLKEKKQKEENEKPEEEKKVVSTKTVHSHSLRQNEDDVYRIIHNRVKNMTETHPDPHIAKFMLTSFTDDVDTAFAAWDELMSAWLHEGEEVKQKQINEVLEFLNEVTYKAKEYDEYFQNLKYTDKYKKKRHKTKLKLSDLMTNMKKLSSHSADGTQKLNQLQASMNQKIPVLIEDEINENINDKSQTEKSHNEKSQTEKSQTEKSQNDKKL